MNHDHLEAATKTATNAEALLVEARILAGHGRWARSYALAHLAQEEAAKAEMIRRLSPDADLEEALAGMRGHPEKLALIGEVVATGDEASPDAQAVIESARETKGLFNQMKNRSLYADYYDGGFWMPSEYIVDEAFIARWLEITQFVVQRIQTAIDGDASVLRRRQAEQQP